MKFVATLMLVGGLAAGAGAKDSPVAGPRLVVEPKAFDFGAILADREVATDFVLRNVGTEDVVIDATTATCGCTVADKDYDKLIKPGGRTVMRVKLKKSFPGRTEQSVLIRWNDPARKPLELKVSALVTASAAAGTP